MHDIIASLPLRQFNKSHKIIKEISSFGICEDLNLHYRTAHRGSDTNPFILSPSYEIPAFLFLTTQYHKLLLGPIICMCPDCLAVYELSVNGFSYFHR